MTTNIYKKSIFNQTPLHDKKCTVQYSAVLPRFAASLRPDLYGTSTLTMISPPAFFSGRANRDLSLRELVSLLVFAASEVVLQLILLLFGVSLTTVSTRSVVHPRRYSGPSLWLSTTLLTHSKLQRHDAVTELGSCRAAAAAEPAPDC